MVGWSNRTRGATYCFRAPAVATFDSVTYAKNIDRKDALIKNKKKTSIPQSGKSSEMNSFRNSSRAVLDRLYSIR